MVAVRFLFNVGASGRSVAIVRPIVMEYWEEACKAIYFDGFIESGSLVLSTEERTEMLWRAVAPVVVNATPRPSLTRLN